MLISREQKIYANIISDGTIRIKCDESDPKAIKRNYELKDGTKGTKIERVYHELSGFINFINFYEGDYGKTLQVTVIDNNEEIILSMGVISNFAEDLMKKIPNIDLSEKVIFRPYSFEDDIKKLRKGITILQNNKKIKSFFHDENNDPINGYPSLTKDIKEYDKEDWKIYFINTRKFLEQYIKINIISKIEQIKIAPLTNEPQIISKIKTPFDEGFNFFDKEIDKNILDPTVQSNDTKEQMLVEINSLLEKKFSGVTISSEEIPVRIIEATGLAFVEPNLPAIIKKLKETN